MDSYPIGRLSPPEEERPVELATTETASGRVQLNQNGFAFATDSASGEAYFVNAQLARQLMTGDEATFLATASAQNREAQQLLHVSRARQRVLCEVREGFSEPWQLVPDDICFIQLKLPATEALLKVGDVLWVEVPEYVGIPSMDPIHVKFLENLGQRSRPNFLTDYVIRRYSIDQEFNPELLIAAPPVVDLSQGVLDVPFVTVDAAETRDYDDAVHVKAHADGGWTVQVAISDVTALLSQRPDLNSIAQQRGTTVYLPGCTIPMLPEMFSIRACSLIEGEVRKAVVMVLRVDAQGTVQSVSVERRNIKVEARLTYDQVTDFVAGKPEVRFGGAVEANLQAMSAVYETLAAQHRKEGLLDIEDPEPSYVRDEAGQWTLVWVVRTVAHKMIEELMLLANRTAASLLVERYGYGIFRHQPKPTKEDWAKLKDWATAHAGVALNDEPSWDACSALIASLPTQEAQAMATQKVRSVMRPAKYVVRSAEEDGSHFSLGVEWYTQFTSPIRRYADVLVHRMLLAPAGSEAFDRTQLEAYAENCSNRAYASRMAERMVWDSLKLQNLLASTEPSTALKARVLRATPRGIRVILTRWQLAAWLPSVELQANGYYWKSGAWSGSSRVPAGFPTNLGEGITVQVSRTSVSFARPAYPDVQVKLEALES